MKILQIVHDFLPRHAAGAEIYAHALSKQLQARGHQLAIFCTEHHPGYTPYAMTEREYDGLHVVEMINNHCHDRFEETYDNPKVDEAFRKIYSAFEPDVVHVHSLMYHSINLLSIIKETHTPVVHTLHDFWFSCEQGGKRLRPDGVLCPEVVPETCARCLATAPTIPGKATQFAYQMFLSFRWMSGMNWAHPAAWLRRKFARESGPPPALVNDMSLADAVRQRNERMLEKLRLVDRFLCPSVFMRDQVVQFGIDPGSAQVSGYGFDHSRFASVERTRGEGIRFGFIGTLAPLKGADVLIEAFGQLDRPGTGLTVYGSLSMYPAYAKKLQSMAQGCAVVFKDAYEPEAVAEVFSNLDVLVVPSVWFENQPLSIQEAFMAQVPVITSRLGGMAELISDGENGLLFEPGDAADLAEKMRQVVDNPGLLARLAASVQSVKTIEEDADAIQALYEELVRSSGSP